MLLFETSGRRRSIPLAVKFAGRRAGRMQMELDGGSFGGRPGAVLFRAHRPVRGRTFRFGGAYTLAGASAKIAIATASLSFAVSALSENVLAAGAAYVVETADVGDPGACKVESWVSAASNHDFFAATSPACVVSLFRPVELSAQIARK